MKDHYTIITGASKGIGAGIAKALCTKGLNLIIVSKTEADLLAVKNTLLQAEPRDPEQTIVHIVTDLSQASGIDQVVSYVKDHALVVDHLVNNAGALYLAHTKDISTKEFQEAMTVNVIAPVTLTSQLLEDFNPQGARVLMLTSSAGRQNSPNNLQGMTMYAASKAALYQSIKTLREDLQVTHPTLLIGSCYPGVVETNMQLALRAEVSPIAPELKQKLQALTSNLAPEQAGAMIVDFLLNEEAKVFGKGELDLGARVNQGLNKTPAPRVGLFQ